MTPDVPPPNPSEDRAAPFALESDRPAERRAARRDVAREEARGDADHPLLEHLDALYGFAQLVTPDADGAARLVRATYARAFAEPAPAEGEQKPWLFGLLLDERREHRAPHPLPAPADAHERPDDLGERRQMLGEALVVRLLPTALLSLSTRQRLILALCDVEGLSCAAAGEVLGLEPAVACGRHAAARDALAESLRAAAAPHEHDLLERALSDGGLQRAVASAFASELAPTPPTLRPTIPVPEPPREPVPNTEGRRATAGWGKVAYAAGLIVGAGLLGSFAMRRAPGAEATDLVTLAAKAAPSAQIMLRTADAAQAEAFARDHAGWRLDLPAIRGLALQGTGLAEVVPGVSVPVFLYAGAPGAGGRAERVTVYAFTYRLLDQARAAVSLEPDVRSALDDDRHYDVHDLGDAKAILWRDRDDVFVAVTQGDADALSRRITR